MKKPILKAYKKKIFFEFLTHDYPCDGIIILPGFPSGNNEDELIRLFYEKDFNVFYLRYEGSFQSDGLFLEEGFIQRLIQTIKEINKGKVKSLWDNQIKSFTNKKLILLSGSFGGAVSCAVAVGLNKKISKLILFSPVWDFKQHNTICKEQDLSHLFSFVKRAYKNLYRMKFNNFLIHINKFKELSPKNYLKKINCSILVFHDPEDETVSINNTKKIIKENEGIKLIEHSFGHGLSKRLVENFWNKIKSFIEYD